MTSQCTKTSRHSKVKVEENKRKAVFINNDNSDYSISRIDNCLITEGKRSDYLVSKVGQASVFVELKGCDVEHACDQLIATVEHPDIQHLIHKPMGFLVICTRFPRFDTKIAKAKDVFAKKYKAGFHVVCNRGEFEISKITKINGRI